MTLSPIDDATLPLVGTWLSQKENYQWLDFGDGVQPLPPLAIKFMVQKDTHLMRVFTADETQEPIGVVALSHLNRRFKTAMLWYLLGDKCRGGKGYTTRAVSRLLRLGFAEHGLEAVHAWAVVQNAPSIRVLEHNHFSYIGRQRRCHYVDECPRDRLLFDLLAAEYQEPLL